MNERRTVHYQGHVQGVGFRYTVHRMAAAISVTGYVQNLADGAVRLVAEGDGRDLDGFLIAIRTQMAHNIRNSSMESSAATGEFGDFEIRH